MASKGKKKASATERANEAKRQTIERIAQLTLWSPDDIEPVLKECNNDQALTIDKILTGDAGRPGMEWQQVSTRARKQRDQTVSQEPVYQDQQQIRQNQRGPKGASNNNGQRFDQNKQRGSGDGQRRRGAPYSPGQQGQTGNKGATQNKRKPMAGQYNNANPRPAGYSGAPGQEFPSEEGSLGGQQHHAVQSGLAPAGPQPVPYSQALTQGNQNIQGEGRPNEASRLAPLQQTQLQGQGRPPQAVHQPQAGHEGHEQIQTLSVQADTNLHNNNGLESLGQQFAKHSISQQQDPLYGQARGSPGAVGSGPGKRTNSPKQFAGSPAKNHPSAKGRRDQPRGQVWQAKDTAASLGNGPSATSARPIGTPANVEPKIRSESGSTGSFNIEEQPEKTEALILPSDLTTDDSGEFSSLHFGNFGGPQTEAVKSDDDTHRQERPTPATHSPVSAPTVTQGPARAAVSRPAPQKDKEEPVQTPNPVPQAAQQSVQRKPAARPQQEKKSIPAHQQSSNRPLDSGISDDGFGQPMMGPEGGHMQMSPFYPPFYVGGPFISTEIDSPQTPIHSQMTYYDNQYPGTSYRASSPHQTAGGDASPKYPYRDASKGYAQQHQVSEAEHDKHRQDADSPTRPHQHSGQSSASPPPGPHPSSQPALHPYSMQTSQYPMYGYPYHQYSYPATSQFPTFQPPRYPVHYTSKPYPSTASGGYPLSPPTSTGYEQELDYGKFMVPQQSYFQVMPDQAPGPSSQQQTGGMNTKGHLGKGQVPYGSGDYKHLDYAQDTRQPQQGYKSQYSAQPTQGYPSQPQYSQPSQYQQSQFPFIHQQPHNVPSQHFQPQPSSTGGNTASGAQSQQPQYS